MFLFWAFYKVATSRPLLWPEFQPFFDDESDVESEVGLEPEVNVEHMVAEVPLRTSTCECHVQRIRRLRKRVRALIRARRVLMVMLEREQYRRQSPREEGVSVDVEAGAELSEQGVELDSLIADDNVVINAIVDPFGPQWYRGSLNIVENVDRYPGVMQRSLTVIGKVNGWLDSNDRVKSWLDSIEL